MHVFSIAVELQSLGHEVVIAVPDSPETVHRHRPPTCQIVDYPTALRIGLPFENSGKPDLIHGWSPRDHVRDFTLAMVERYTCPYFVHMEDNEEQIVADEMSALDYETLRKLPSDVIDAIINPYRSHPHRYRSFVEGAVGYTCLIDRLLEFKSKEQPGVVFWAGFESEFAKIDGDTLRDRAEFGLRQDETILFYGGNVHFSIASDIRNLYVATLLLRRKGLNVRLLRTGWNYAPLGIEMNSDIDECVTELGFVPREQMSKLIGVSDILVQPGRSDAFNDYRFPSKLPEYLASGRPVILPDTNIGRALEQGHDCLKLNEGTIPELMAAIERLAADSAMRKKLGANGRAFAMKHLSWARAGEILGNFYASVMGERAAKEKEAMAAPTTYGIAKAGAKSKGATTLSTADKSKSETKIDTAKPEKEPKVVYPAKLVAFYLPQFHPIPENDEWWGKGFTEWTNVSRAKPQFAGHSQPRLPTELGYYDLRVVETLHKQVDLALEYGVGAFCFYYYWFNGRRLLEKPLDLWLSKEGPDFPFCICWANENWSRRWDGSESEILMEQTYNDDNDVAFIKDIIPILKDPRYLRVDGSPVLLLYRANILPDPIATASTWRRIAAEHGLTLHLCIVQSFGLSDPRPYGFDAAVEFSPPHVDRQLIDPARVPGVASDFKGYIEDYVSVALKSVNAPPTDYIKYRGCFPTWDNTARRKNGGHIFINDSPKAYAHWLRFLVQESLVRRDQVEPLIFINAWNEWAEGTYLEPDERYGRDLLEVTKLALHEGIIDVAKGVTADRDRAFSNLVARLPKY
jgi:glycosyltransferase involved in cell wall biosynthesis